VRRGFDEAIDAGPALKGISADGSDAP